MRGPLSLLGPLLVLQSTAAFNFVREYSGQSFFDRWNFYGTFDNLTNGDVEFADKATAFNTSNPLVMVNSAGNAVMKVDNVSTVLFNDKRTSVRIDSMDTYDVGSLWVIDIVHMPMGCSVWPAFFTIGTNWPTHGEIDIVEGWNLVTQNQMSLHTTAGCTLPTTLNQLGTQKSADCNNQNATVGCGVLAPPSNPSFGQPFNAGGGGVWATQFDESGIFIWFWNRSSVPDDLKRNNQAKTLDPSTFGTPAASFPNNNCNVPQFFGSQTLALDITLCGDAAGDPAVYNATCLNEPPNTPNPGIVPGSGRLCYPVNVVGPGSPRYDDAFFEISHIRAYTTGAVPAATGTSGSGSSSGSGSGSGASQSGSSAVKTGFDIFPMVISFAVVAVGVLVGGWMV